MKTLLLASILFVHLVICPRLLRGGCPPDIQWQASYGGSRAERLFVLELSSDGGYILGGSSSSTDGTKTSPAWGSSDFWMVCLDPGGTVLWDRSFGGSGIDEIAVVREVAEGGWILGGRSQSAPGGTKTAPAFGEDDIWLVRVDAAGNRLWDQCYGGDGSDDLLDLAVAADGGFLLVGRSWSPPSGNKTSPNYGKSDAWILRLDARGNELWERSFGGAERDSLRRAILLSDGGWLLGGGSESPPGEIKTAPHYGESDCWLLRLDAQGNAVWEHSFGGSEDDVLLDLALTPEANLLAGCESASPPGGTKTSPLWGRADYWVVELDPTMQVLWEQSFGGTQTDHLETIVPTCDGGLLLAGHSRSGVDGNKTSPNRGAPLATTDFWLVRLDAQGGRLWEQTYGGSGPEALPCVQATPDGGYIVGGFSLSEADGNKTTPLFGFSDAWLVKLAPEDGDCDGVPDRQDRCPGTAAHEAVDAEGCSIEQRVPADGPWRNRGEYIRALAAVSRAFVQEGLISARERAALLRQAARTSP